MNVLTASELSTEHIQLIDFMLVCIFYYTCIRDASVGAQMVCAQTIEWPFLTGISVALVDFLQCIHNSQSDGVILLWFRVGHLNLITYFFY